jgi:uncharacterized iron-regulated membrane protein
MSFFAFRLSDNKVNNHKATANRLLALKARRKIWLNVHLWLGLIFGLFLAILGLTGSILVFHEEIDEWLNRDLIVVNSQNNRPENFRSLSEVLTAVNKVIPGGAALDMIIYPRNKTSNFKFTYHLSGQTEVQPEIWQVFVDPFKAEVVGKRLIKTDENTDPATFNAFTAFIFKLHYELFCGAIGKLVIGIFASFLIFSVLTGLILWWPLTNQWRRVLTIKRSASPERFNHDLHQVSGFYFFPVLLILCMSGIYMNLPDQFLALTRLFLPGSRGYLEFPQSSNPQGRQPIGLEQALLNVQTYYPEGKISMLVNPIDERGTYTIVMNDVPLISHFWSERQIAIDQYNGSILGVRSPDNRLTAGETFLDWQWPLHSGKAFGWPGRILICLTGLACPMLFTTGLIRWIQKKRVKLLSKK